MKTIFLIVISAFTGIYAGAFIMEVVITSKQQKSPIKLIRKGCCQYRLNEFTHEVTHFEGCDNLSHCVGCVVVGDL